MAHSVHKHSTRTRHRVNIVWLENARDPVAQKHGNAFKSFEKNPKWWARDLVARKRGNAFKFFEKTPKMIRILGHLLFRRLRKLRLRCAGVGSALKKVARRLRRYEPALALFFRTK